MATVGLLIVGDEILSGEVRDENGPFLLALLKESGACVVRIATVPDDRDAIRQELGRLRAIADHVVLSGGIGPTHDDVTRPAVSEALGLQLMVHPAIEARIHEWYGEDAQEAELGMALLPEGAELVDGERTGTFGFHVDAVWVLPGVPALFRDIARALPARFGGAPCCRSELHSDRREGEIAPRLAEVQSACPDVAIGSYPELRDGRWHVRVVLRAPNEERLQEVAEAIRPVL